jgi:hypothetical protein
MEVVPFDDLMLALVFLVLPLFYTVVVARLVLRAGQTGAAAYIPLYNVALLFRVCGLSPWLALPYFIPLIGLLVHFRLSLAVSRSFRCPPLLFVGVLVVPAVGLPILAYGNFPYRGPNGSWTDALTTGATTTDNLIHEIGRRPGGPE